MREIKFRGKQHSWIYGGVSIHRGEATIYDYSCLGNSAYEVDLKSVGQFTGLKDKNGVEIYEGDILSAGRNSNRPSWKKGHDYHVVCFSNGEFVGKGYNGEMQVSPSLNHLQFKCKVIGNIHENSDLI